MRFLKRNESGWETPGFRRPNLLGCLAGVALSLVLIMGFLFLVDVVKLFGEPFMLLPQALGIVEPVDRDAVVAVAPRMDDWVVVPLQTPGPYFVVVADYYGWLPEMEVQMLDSAENEVHLEPFERGVRPYDSAVVRGLPIYKFMANEPGEYWLRIVGRSNQPPDTTFLLSMVPDTVSGREGTLARIISLQLGVLILAIVLYIYFRRIRPRLAREEEIAVEQDERRASMDDFLESYRQKEEDKT